MWNSASGVSKRSVAEGSKISTPVIKNDLLVGQRLRVFISEQGKTERGVPDAMLEGSTLHCCAT